MKKATRDNIVGNACFEALEDRRLMSSVQLVDGMLIIQGNVHANNRLSVTLDKGGHTVFARANGVKKHYQLKDVKSIRIGGGVKRDTVEIDSSIKVDSYIRTSSGKDLVKGGGGSDTVFGGADADTLIGNGGDDLLVGGSGPDQVNAGAEDDPTQITEKYSSYTVAVTSFTLVDPKTGKAIGTVGNGATLNMAKLPKRLNIVANVSSGGNNGSVEFRYDGIKIRDENAAPFTLGADNNGKFYNWTPRPGAHTLVATPFSGKNGSGTAGQFKLITFTVVRDANAPALQGGDVSGSGSTGGGNTGGTGNNSGGTGTNNGGGTGTGNNTGGGTGNDNGGGTGTNNGGGTGTNNNGGGGTVKNDPGGPAVVIDALQTTIPAGSAVHVNALKTTLKTGDVLGAKFEWDFGDKGAKYNNLVGFNAAHLYTKAGTYTVTLRVTNSAGKVGTVQSKVTVTPANRHAIYVSPSGNDTNSGRTQSAAVKTFKRAAELVGDNTEILFQRGATYGTNQVMSLGHTNVLLGAYGSGTNPVLQYVGTTPHSAILSTNGGKNVTVRDVTFDTTIKSTLDSDMNDAICVGGDNIAVVNCKVANAGYFINTNGQPDGFLAQDNATTSASSLRAYFAWVQGQDQVYLGNKCDDSRWQHCLRMAGGDRVLIAYNDFTNVTNPNGIMKGTLTLHVGNYVYATGNKLTDGNLDLGPLDKSTGLNNKGARLNWVVVEGNQITNTNFDVLHGLNHVAIRNNVIRRDNNIGINMPGWSDLFGRGTTDVYIEHNTVINKGTKGMFLKLQNHVEGITMTNNLYVAPKLAIDGGDGPLQIQTGNLNSFRAISDNVWPLATTGRHVTDGEMYVTSKGLNDAAGYKTNTQWESYAQVDHDQFKNVTLSVGDYDVSLGGITAGAALSAAA